MNETSQRKELRIVLDGPATEAYESMVSRMKETVSTVKVQPSYFVSFLMIDYLETYFEKDLAILIAEFFDSDAFYEVERKLAKGKPDYEELMQSALDRARQIKGKRRSKAVRNNKKQAKETAVTPV